MLFAFADTPAGLAAGVVGRQPQHLRRGVRAGGRPRPSPHARLDRGRAADCPSKCHLEPKKIILAKRFIHSPVIDLDLRGSFPRRPPSIRYKYRRR